MQSKLFGNHCWRLSVSADAVGGPAVRVGIPLVGGQLVEAARRRGYPVLFSANAFAKTYPKGHEQEGFFRGFRLPDASQLAGLDAALDSAGFVAAAKYRDYRWSVDEYLDLVESHPWAWWAAMDMCCEKARARPASSLELRKRSASAECTRSGQAL